jgi:Na+-driven multidrug efflux pump
MDIRFIAGLISGVVVFLFFIIFVEDRFLALLSKLYDNKKITRMWRFVKVDGGSIVDQITVNFFMFIYWVFAATITVIAMAVPMVLLNLEMYGYLVP